MLYFEKEHVAFKNEAAAVNYFDSVIFPSSYEQDELGFEDFLYDRYRLIDIFNADEATKEDIKGEYFKYCYRNWVDDFLYEIEVLED